MSVELKPKIKLLLDFSNKPLASRDAYVSFSLDTIKLLGLIFKNALLSIVLIEEPSSM